jgi:hypothetical protein
MFVTRADLLNLQNNFGTKIIDVKSVDNGGDANVYNIGSS